MRAKANEQPQDFMDAISSALGPSTVRHEPRRQSYDDAWPDFRTHGTDRRTDVSNSRGHQRDQGTAVPSRSTAIGWRPEDAAAFGTNRQATSEPYAGLAANDRQAVAVVAKHKERTGIAIAPVSSVSNRRIGSGEQSRSTDGVVMVRREIILAWKRFLAGSTRADRRLYVSIFVTVAILSAWAVLR